MDEGTFDVLIQKISDLMDKKLEEKLGPIKQDLQVMKNSMQFALDEVNKITVLEDQLADTSETIKHCEAVICNLKHQNNLLEDKTLKLESYMRKQNIKLWGIPEEKNENLEEKLLKLFSEHDVNLVPRDIITVHRLGPFKKRAVRSVIVRFSHLKDKTLVSSKKAILKQKGVIVTEDYPLQVTQHRRVILPIFFKALDKYRHLNPKLNVDKIALNNRWYDVHNLNEIPEEDLRPENVFTKEKNGVTAFFTKYSWFSNHNSEFLFIEDGREFTTVEQYLMYRKAIIFNDQDSADEILSETDPVQNKLQGWKIRNFKAEQWNKVAEDELFKGEYAKYAQNTLLKECQLKTGSNMLAEASPTDMVYGVGFPLRSPNVFDPTKWKGKNLMEKVLERVRNLIK